MHASASSPSVDAAGSSAPRRGNKASTPLRLALSVALASGAGLAALTVTMGLSGSLPAALVLAVLAAGGVMLRVAKKQSIVLDEAAVSPALGWGSAAIAVAALVLLGRLSVFMVDASQVDQSNIPASAWEVRHSCLTAYFVAATAAGQGRSVFDDSLYTQPGDTGKGVRKPLMLGRFGIDVYEYPPPFLLLPRMLALLSPDFMRLRALWFGLNVGVLLLAMVLVAQSLAPAAGTRALLSSPLAWAALPTLSLLQKGNVQGIVIALSMLAMVLFERRRCAFGGALLAFAIVSKLFPALLVVYLLVRRQWAAVAWTAGASVLLILVSLVDVGWQQYVEFAAHLPGLLGGEAFPAFRNPAAIAINYSIPGLVFKAGLFGVPGMSFLASKAVGWVWTAISLGVIAAFSRRTLHATQRPLVWMSILILGTLRSPFLPQAYAAFPPLWLLTLLAATYAPVTKALGLTLLAWLTFNVFWPQDWPLDPRLLALLTVLPQALTLLMAVLALRRSVALSAGPRHSDARGSAAVAQRLDQERKGRGGLPSARVVEMVAGVR
jgi:alpha-1,2-mannosyltransferase